MNRKGSGREIPRLSFRSDAVLFHSFPCRTRIDRKKEEFKGNEERFLEQRSSTPSRPRVKMLSRNLRANTTRWDSFGRKNQKSRRCIRERRFETCRKVLVHTAAAARREDSPSEQSPGKSSLDAAQRKMANASKLFRKLGYFGFWSQLVLSVVSAVILVFSVAFTTTSQTAPGAGMYLTLFGILAGFFSMFWSLGYTRIARKLRKGAFQISEAPARVQVMRNLSTGITINCAGLLSGILGLQSTVGLLVAKTLTSATVNPFLGMGTNKIYNPVMALDVFLVQACANSLSCHILGLLLSLWLLRDVAKPAPA